MKDNVCVQVSRHAIAMLCTFFPRVRVTRLVVWYDFTHDPIDGSILKLSPKPEVVIPVAMTLWKYSMTIDIRKGLFLRTDLQ